MAIRSPRGFVLNSPYLMPVNGVEEGCVKSSEEVMEILEAVDATGSRRAAAELWRRWW